jgi:hypothetical protein
MNGSYDMDKVKPGIFRLIGSEENETIIVTIGADLQMSKRYNVYYKLLKSAESDIPKFREIIDKMFVKESREFVEVFSAITVLRLDTSRIMEHLDDIKEKIKDETYLWYCNLLMDVKNFLDYFKKNLSDRQQELMDSMDYKYLN